MQGFAFAVDHIDPEHEVPHTAGTGATGAAQPCGDHTADRGLRGGEGWQQGNLAPRQPVMGRFKRQTLIFFSQDSFQLRQRRASTHGDDQLTRLVARDTRQTRGVQNLALQRLAVKVFGATATNAERGFVVRRCLDAVNDLGE